MKFGGFYFLASVERESMAHTQYWYSTLLLCIFCSLRGANEIEIMR